MKLLACCMLFAGLALGQESKLPSFRITLAAEHSIVAAGTDILVKVSLTNISGRDINNSRAFMANTGDSTLRFEVWDRSGRLAPKRTYPHPELETGSVVFDTIVSGETVVEDENVNRIYDMTKPGKYTVQVSRSDPQYGPIKSNTITITVVDSLTGYEEPPFRLIIGAYSNGEPGTNAGLTAKSGADIGLNIQKWNVSKGEVDCSTAINNVSGLEDKYDYEILDENGNPVPRRAVAVGGHPYFGDRTMPCRPGESAYSNNVTLTKVYDLTRPGVYTIQVLQPVSRSAADDHWATRALWCHGPQDCVVKSNKITVTVTP